MARELLAAARVIDSEPETALAHARAARQVARRLPVVREAVGVAAYLTGEWAEALSELRAARRMGGAETLLHVIADCERALGRPERALQIAASAEAERLPQELAVEMAIVVAGARRDMGQVDAALVTLESAGLDSPTEQPWTARLWYAYADTLEHAGRRAEARRWFAAVRDIDEDETTDAAQRVRALGEGTSHG